LTWKKYRGLIAKIWNKIAGILLMKDLIKLKVDSKSKMMLAPQMKFYQHHKI
jgi:hypothetical protein